jgi:hypothetical protein
LSLTHHPHRQDDDGDIDVMKWKLSELLARDGNQIQTLRFDFENDEVRNENSAILKVLLLMLTFVADMVATRTS